MNLATLMPISRRYSIIVSRLQSTHSHINAKSISSKSYLRSFYHRHYFLKTTLLSNFSAHNFCSNQKFSNFFKIDLFRFDYCSLIKKDFSTMMVSLFDNQQMHLFDILIKAKEEGCSHRCV